MNYFLDTEFSQLPWKKNVELISIAIVDENGRGYYACSNEFDENTVSPFVKKEILPHLPEVKYRKSIKVIKSELIAFVDKDPENFWSIFPTVEQVEILSENRNKASSLLKKFGDFDFQLLKSIFYRNYPRNWPEEGKNLTSLFNLLSKEEIPKNRNSHDALADARWNLEVWKKAEEISAIGNLKL